jgi:hypothetical protein
LEDYAQRKGEPVEEAARWLSQHLDEQEVVVGSAR